MRHTLCSNWLAFHEKIDRLVLISGHDSVDTMWRHYYRGTTKAAATAFWNLYPPAMNPENVVSFPIAEETYRVCRVSLNLNDVLGSLHYFGPRPIRRALPRPRLEVRTPR